MIKKIVFLLLATVLLGWTSGFAATKYFTQKSLTALTPGKENQEVKALQQALWDFGYYKSEEDEPEFSGKFENDLFLAIKDFQETNEIRVTGRADFATLKVVNEFIKFQNDSEAEEEAENPNLASKEGDGFVGEYKFEEYSVEGADYFDEEDNRDVADLYGGPNFQKQFDEEEGVTQARSKPTSKGSGTGVIGNIFGSILNFFMPSKNFKTKAQLELDAEMEREKNSQGENSGAEKFKDYDFLDCTQDDDCIKLMEANEAK